MSTENYHLIDNNLNLDLKFICGCKILVSSKFWRSHNILNPKIRFLIIQIKYVCGQISKTLWLKFTWTNEDWNFLKVTYIIVNKNEEKWFKPALYEVTQSQWLRHPHYHSCHSQTDTSAWSALHRRLLAPCGNLWKEWKNCKW